MKNVVVHAVLAVLGLFWAYQVWTTEEEAERPATEVEILKCADADFQRVELRSKHKNVAVQQRESAHGPYVWVQSAALRDGKVNKRTEFAGNQAAKDFVNEITPLRALRSLGKVQGKVLEDLGLKKSDLQVQYKCNNKTHTLAIGGSTFGSADRYARLGKDGPIYLLKADLLQNLEAAESRLMQRKLQSFALGDIDEINVTVSKRTRTLLHRDRRDTQRAQWVDKAKPDQRNELYGNWLRALDALQVSEYLGPKDAPGRDAKGKAGKPIPVLSISYTAEGANKGNLEVVRVDGPTPEYYARSGSTQSWVRLVASSAKRAVDDASIVVGLQAAPPKPIPPPAMQSMPKASTPMPPGHP